MSLIQLLKFKTWETRLFKIPHLEMPRFQMPLGLVIWNDKKVLAYLMGRFTYIHYGNSGYGDLRGGTQN